MCPGSAKIHNQMCTLRSNQGRHEEALAHCRASLAIDPAFCDVHSNFAFIHIARNDLGRAVPHLNASLPCPWTNVRPPKGPHAVPTHPSDLARSRPTSPDLARSRPTSPDLARRVP